jgi:uncharacterized delta-60 repeat protein
VIVVGSTDPRDDGNTDFFLARFNADGSIDRGFGLGGVVRTDFAGGADVAHGVALAAGGKIVVVGSSVEGAETELAVARYNANGSLDATFSDDGRRSAGYAGRADVAYGVVIDAAGKIVLAGASGSDFLLGRLNANGTNDTSFSGDGLDQAGFGGTEAARGIALRGNGQIVAAGSTTNGAGGSDIAAVLYNPNGVRVSGFGTDGKRKVDLFGQFDQGWGVAVDATGRVVLGATTAVGFTDALAVVRLDPATAAFDSSFGGDGIVIVGDRQRTDSFAEGGGVFTVGDTITVGGGWAFDTGSSFFDRESVIARITPIGSPDDSLFEGGVQFPGGTLVGIRPAPDGKTVLTRKVFSSTGFVVSRLTEGGVGDTSFGREFEDGVVTLPNVFGAADNARSFVRLADGRGVLLGSYLGRISLIRYNANGTVDTSFGTNGRLFADLPQISDDPEQQYRYRPEILARQPDDRLLAAGTLVDGRDIAVGAAVLRFSPNGALDPTFGGGDGVLTAFTPDDSGPEGLRVLSDGRFILVIDDANLNFTYIRYNANGTRDTSFAPFTFDPGSGENASGPIIEIAPDGKLIGGGTDEDAPDRLGFEGPTTALFRLNTNGTLDPTFSGDGVLWDYAAGAPGDELPGNARVDPSVTLQADGKILFQFLVAPEGEDPFRPTTSDVGLMRLTAGGAIDTSFGNTGTVHLDFGPEDLPVGDPLLQTDGKILVAARQLSSGEPTGVLDVARLNSNGAADDSFGAGGVTVLTFGAGESPSLESVSGNRALVRRGLRPFGRGGVAFSQLDLGTVGASDPTAPSIAIQSGVLRGRGTAGNDVITIRRVGSDNVLVTINATSAEFDMDDFAGGVHLEGLGGDDQITVVDSLLSPVARRVTLSGGAGNDTLAGKDGGDSLLGGDGNDFLTASFGNDTLDGGAGNDTADGGPGADTIRNAEITPPDGLIRIVNGVLTADGQWGQDLITIGRTGSDDVIVRVNEVSRQFDMDDFTGVLLRGNNGFDDLRVLQPIVAGSIVRKVTLEGGNGNDTLTGAAGDDVIRGGEGADALVGLDGSDALFGGGGNDSLFGGTGADFMDGGDAADVLDATDGTPGDSVLGGNGDDSAKADAGDEVSGVETVT